MIELGRISMITKVNTMASHLALPREGYLENVFHMFACLKIKYTSRLVFNPTYPDIDMSSFKVWDQKHFHTIANEAIPDKPSGTRGGDIDLRMFVDSKYQVTMPLEGLLVSSSYS